MPYREFNDFSATGDHVSKITPILYSPESRSTSLGKSILFILHTEEQLIAFGVDMESPEDNFEIPEEWKFNSKFCDFCKRTKQRPVISLESLDANEFDKNVFKSKDMELDQELEFNELQSVSMCEDCYTPLLDDISDWLVDNSSKLSSYVI